MRLINCQTLSLEEFSDNKQVAYAILSHTWETGGEVLYGDFGHDQAKAKKGWGKIEASCILAVADGLKYLWIDTCCIDKSSSAELSEAINSMFVWYRDANVCYAYLADHDTSLAGASMSDSRWFKRGWTLQELIAPNNVHFYDRAWRHIGRRQGLFVELAAITGIDEGIMRASHRCHLEQLLESLPVAVRMSWASTRVTTRVEDIAYCLLGIFGVNLPLLYGEGERAFTRLQEEIIRNTNDLSILAWARKSIECKGIPYCGILAHSPSEFGRSGGLQLANDLKFMPDFAITNKGLHMQTLLQYDDNSELHVLELNCRHPKVISPRRLAIYLKHQGASVFARAKPDQYTTWNNRIVEGSWTDIYAENRSIYLSKSLSPQTAIALSGVNLGSFQVDGIGADQGFSPSDRSPDHLYNFATGLWITQGLQDFVGTQLYTPSSKQDTPSVRDFSSTSFYLLFGFGYGYAPWVKIAPPNRSLQLRLETANWRWLAQESNDSPCQSLQIGPSTDGGTTLFKFVHVDLEWSERQGNARYHVRVSFTDEPSPALPLNNRSA